MKHDTDVRDTESRPASEGCKPDGQPLNTSRRRFTRAGLSASVVMTLASRTALANHCSVSAGMSGNLSRPHQGDCYGLTPGFWKTHPEEWSCGYEPGMCNPITYKNGECKDWWHVTWGDFKANEVAITAKDPVRPGFANLYEDYKAWANWNDGTPDGNYPAPSVPPTTLGDAFAGSSLAFTDPDQTMMQAFWDPPGDIDPQTLVAHASAALLNVCRFGEETFGYTRNGLIQFMNNWTGGLEALKDALQDLNERGGS